MERGRVVVGHVHQKLVLVVEDVHGFGANLLATGQHCNQRRSLQHTVRRVPPQARTTGMARLTPVAVQTARIHAHVLALWSLGQRQVGRSCSSAREAAERRVMSG